MADQLISMPSGGDGSEDSDSVRVVEPETPSERLQRYLKSELCEVSDQEEWTALHYREGSPP